MTAQIPDLFLHNGVEYSLAGISEGALFEPSLFGLEPVANCTVCWRGASSASCTCTWASIPPGNAKRLSS